MALQLNPESLKKVERLERDASSVPLPQERNEVESKPRVRVTLKWVCLLRVSRKNRPAV